MNPAWAAADRAVVVAVTEAALVVAVEAEVVAAAGAAADEEIVAATAEDSAAIDTRLIGQASLPRSGSSNLYSSRGRRHRATPPFVFAKACISLIPPNVG